MFSQVILQYAFDGPAMVSTGQRVTEWTAQEQPCKKKKNRKRKRRIVRISSLNASLG